MKNNLLLPVSNQPSSEIKRSSWRTTTPRKTDKAPPCKEACPLKSKIPRWLAMVWKMNLADAFNTIYETNPFPGICGEICHHPCEKVCLRAEFDEAISIRELEKIVAKSFWFKVNSGSGKKPADFIEKTKAKKEKIAIIGAGPAGLSCAWYLLRRGYQVTVCEASSKVGGMLSLAIPEFRLPKKIISDDFSPIISHPNLTLRLNHKINGLNEFGKGAFDAIVIATGSHKSKKLNIPGENLSHVITGLKFLRKAKEDKTEKLVAENDLIIVIGGGNTAIDSARTAKKLGAGRVELYYRREKSDMPAIKEEIELAEKEGINFNFLLSPKEIREKKTVFEEMTPGETDSDGRKIPIPTGKIITVHPIDRNGIKIISAIGENPSRPAINTKKMPRKVFICGDAKYGPSFVSKAISSGIKTAEKIMIFLEGHSMEKTPSAKINIMRTSDIKTNLFEKSKRETECPGREAARCFSCGTCPDDSNICSKCQDFCPDMAAETDGKINLDYCKGCLICAEECPRGVISIKEEK